MVKRMDGARNIFKPSPGLAALTGAEDADKTSGGEASTPTRRQPRKRVSRQAGKPASPHAGMPAKRQTGNRAHVKATFYLDPEDLAALERERLARISKGTPRREADLSALVREAVGRAYGGW